MGLQYNLVRREEGANITVVVDGEMFVADDNHPLFDEIVDAAIDNDESVVDLFDTSHRVSEVFANLSERVRVANSRVYVDGFEVNDVYADTLVKYLESDVTDDERTALVNFLEKVYSMSLTTFVRTFPAGLRPSSSRCFLTVTFLVTVA
jgi:hypothetical protein